MCVLSNLCVLYIFSKPLLQVHKNSVRYHQYSDSKLEGLVRTGVYPPSIKCAVLYNSPRDFERPSLDTFHMTIAGTNKDHVSFPIKVYSAIGESKCRSMKHLYRLKQFDMCWHAVCCSLSCTTIPITAECAEGVLVVFYSLHSQKGLPHDSLPLSHHSLPLSHHSLPLSHHSLPLTKVSGHQHSLTAPTLTHIAP